MTQDNILVSPKSSECVKCGEVDSPPFRPSDLGDTLGEDSAIRSRLAGISSADLGLFPRRSTWLLIVTPCNNQL